MSQTAETKIRVSAKDDASSVFQEISHAIARLERDLLGFGSLAATAFAGFSVGQYVKEATLMAARYETLGIVMEQAGKNAGYGATQMHGFERSLLDSGIAMNEARETMARLSAANIDLSKSSQLARVAQDLAVVGGINSSEALTRMTHGIVSGEIEILRTLGLNVTFEESYKRLATQLGKNTDALSAQEKMQARVNIVLDAGSRYAGIYEASMTTAGKQMTSLARYFANIKTLAGEAGLQAFSVGIMGISENAQKAEQSLRAMSDSGELGQISQDIGHGFAEGIALVDNAAVSLAAWVVIRKLATSESLKALAADAQLHGSLATAKDRLALLSAAEQKRLAATAAQTQATRALIVEEMRHLESQALQQAIAVRQADLLAARMVGTQNEARAVAVLDAARARLAVTTTALSAAEMRLAGTTVSTAASLSGMQLAMNGLRGAGASVVSLLGGPWVAGLTVAAGAAYVLYETISSRNAELETARKHMLGISSANGEMEKSMDSLQRKVSAFAFKDKMESELEVATKALEDAQRKFEGFNLATQGVTLEERFFGISASSGFAEVKTMLEEVKSGALSASEGYVRLAEFQEQFGKTAPIVAARDALALLATAMDVAKQKQEAVDRAMYQWLGTLTDAELKAMNTAAAVTVLKERMDAASRSFRFDQFIIPEGDLNKFLSDQSFAKYLNTLDDKSKHTAQSLRRLNGVTEEMIRLTLAGKPPTEQLAKAAKAAGDAYKVPKRSGKSTDSALIALQGLNAELAKLEGRKTDSFAENLSKKLMDIARKGKEAGLSLGEIGALQDRYSVAAQVNLERQQGEALRKLQAETASALGNDSNARTMEREAGLRRWNEELLGLGLTLQQVQPLLDGWNRAQEQKSTIKDAEAAANFYRELAQLSGNYGISIEKQNELLRIQAQSLVTNVGISQELADEWARLQRLETSRDWYAGFERGMRKWSSSATDAASQVEGALTSAFDGASDALANMVMTGKADFASLANSIIADMTRIAAKQAIGGIVGGIGNIIGKALGGWLGGGLSVSTGIGSAGWQGGAGGSWAGGGWDSGMALPVSSFHTGGLVGVDGARDRTMPVSLFDKAPRFHDGGGYFRQDEYPAVLQYGERVLNRRDTVAFDAAMRMPRAPMPVMPKQASAAPTIIVHNYAKGTEAKAEAQQQPDGSFKIDVIVEEVDRRIAQRVTSGKSHTARALDATRGMSPAPAAYRG